MQISVNERRVEVADGSVLGHLVSMFKPDADVVVLNGFPADALDVALEPDDTVTLIRKGETPSEAELSALMAARHTPGVHDVVRAATVGIAGVGGLGSSVALALARTGIGRLVIVDHDVVEPSNLNRQQYFVDQIGLPKVTALAETLARVNPFVEVVAHRTRVSAENAAELFSDVDVVVEAFDAAEQKAMLVGALLARFPDRPVVAASGMAGHGTADSVATKRHMRGLYVVGDQRTAAGAGVGLMAPRVGVAAHHQANAVLRLLLGMDPTGSREGEARAQGQR